MEGERTIEKIATTKKPKYEGNPSVKPITDRELCVNRIMKESRKDLPEDKKNILEHFSIAVEEIVTGIINLPPNSYDYGRTIATIDAIGSAHQTLLVALTLPEYK